LGYIIAPLEAYPQPIVRSALSKQLSGDVIEGCVASPNIDNCPTPDPLSNDNYLFNVSHTLGERVTCALLRGADDVLHPGTTTLRDGDARCALFANDALLPAGADVTVSDQLGG